MQPIGRGTQGQVVFLLFVREANVLFLVQTIVVVGHQLLHPVPVVRGLIRAVEVGAAPQIKGYKQEIVIPIGVTTNRDVLPMPPVQLHLHPRLRLPLLAVAVRGLIGHVEVGAAPQIKDVKQEIVIPMTVTTNRDVLPMPPVQLHLRRLLLPPQLLHPSLLAL